MPNKRVNNLKDDTMRGAGQEWQSALGIDDLTTNEWDYAVHLEMDEGMSDEEAANEIRRRRRR